MNNGCFASNWRFPVSKTWYAKITLGLGSISQEKIKGNKYLREHFKDPENPTEDEVRAYFENVQQNYAGSNDGSELIANADLQITSE